jgi:hypothetical protein
VAPSTDADVVQKVPADTGPNLDRGEILHQTRNAGLDGGSLFQAVGLRLKNSAGLGDGRRIERTGTAPSAPAAEPLAARAESAPPRAQPWRTRHPPRRGRGKTRLHGWCLLPPSP